MLDAGVADVGENYAKDLEAKAAQVPGVRWHFVGRLQRNKAGLLVEAGALVHSLDSLAGARALGRRALAAGTTARALVQVEVDDREAAHGVRPAGLAAFLDDCRAVDGLEVEGLMVMLAPADDPEATRPAFRRAAELAAGSGLPRLSMGMTTCGADRCRMRAVSPVVIQYEPGSDRWRRQGYDVSAIASASPGVTGRPWNSSSACSRLHPRI